LGYLKASESTGVHPRDWMLSSVPVIPPKFRPVSEMQGGKVPLIDDANYLYKLMIDTNNSLKELRKYTKNTKEDEYGLYNTYQQVTGLADPSHPKLVQREVKGLLKHIFGVGSSKFSTVQRNLLGTPTDMVGRGVIVPDPDLGLDEVGIPEQKAWDTYRPHIIHRLTRRGVPWALASKMVEDQNPVAKDALLQEMGTRPVIVDRAPVLHKWGILAFKPKLVAGDAIRVNHFVNKGYNSDHDGNCCDYDTEIFIRLSKSNLQREDDPNKLQDEDKADAALHLFVSNLEKSLMSISDEVSIDVFRRGKVIPVKIGLLPKLGIPVKDKNNADVHSIPKGVEVLSYDVNTGESGFAPISAYTVEHDVACVRVTTSGGRSVVVSDNESLAAYNHETGCLEKITPAKCQGRLVPVVKQRGYSGNKYSRSLGWFYGALISDGWVTARTVGYAKVDESKRRFFESVARTEIEPNFISRTYKESAKGQKNKLADSVKIHLNGRDLATKIFKCVADPTGQEEGGRAALRKYIPRELLYGGSRECWLGLLAGLLEGDGTMTWNYTYKKKRAVIRFSTSSERLVADIRDLGSRLGFGMSVTVTPPRGFSHTAYSVCLSIPDMWNLFGELEFVSESAKQFQKDFLAVPMSCNMRDIVPVMESEAEYVTQLLPADRGTPVSIKAARGAFSRAKITGYFSRDVVKQYLQYVPDDSCPELRKHVAATDITWEVYETVEPVESRDVFDISVEGTKVFVVGTGLVVFDTMNFHVPMSEDAVKEAYELLLPSKSLIQARDMKSAQPRIISEGLGGLFLATLPPDKKQKPRTFVSWADAEKAYRSGNLAIDDPVVVLSSKPLPRR
jgi:hypothetical protein